MTDVSTDTVDLRTTRAELVQFLSRRSPSVGCSVGLVSSYSSWASRGSPWAPPRSRVWPWCSLGVPKEPSGRSYDRSCGGAWVCGVRAGVARLARIRLAASPTDLACVDGHTRARGHLDAVARSAVHRREPVLRCDPVRRVRRCGAVVSGDAHVAVQQHERERPSGDAAACGQEHDARLVGPTGTCSAPRKAPRRPGRGPRAAGPWHRASAARSHARPGRHRRLLETNHSTNRASLLAVRVHHHRASARPRPNARVVADATPRHTRQETRARPRR